jgi:hypothetical protein
MEGTMAIADNKPNSNRSAERSVRWISELAIGTRLKALLARPRLILNPLLLLVFCAAWLRDVLYWFPKDAFGTSLNYWAFTDWLFDYSQGFIRRGLSGEMWRLVPATIAPLEFVAVLSWILILIMAFGYLRLLVRSWKTFHPLTLFGLLFLPSLFFFYLHDHNAIARKEILGYGAVLLHLLVIEKSFPLGADSKLPDRNLRRYVRWLIPITALLLPAIILIHEGSFLLFVPLHAMVTLTILQAKGSRSLTQAALWTGLLYLPAAIAFAAVYISGTPSYQTLFGVCEKWVAAGAIREGTCVLPPSRLSGSTLPASFEPMAWSLKQVASLTQFFISTHWKEWLLILPTLGASLWYIIRQAVYSVLRSRSSQPFSEQSAQRYTGIFFGKYFCIPFLLALPIYFSAWDYGRWFAITSVNFAMLAVSMNLPCLEFALRKKSADEASAATDPQEHLDHRLVFYGVSIVICVLALVLWLPHYCLFSCEIVRSPLEFFSHTFTAR